LVSVAAGGAAGDAGGKADQPCHFSRRAVMFVTGCPLAASVQSGHRRTVMHELSIAHSLVEVATRAATDAHVARVTAVHLRLGALAGVVKESLLFCYDLAAGGTALEGSRLIIEDVPVKVKCERCTDGCEPAGRHDFHCPKYDLVAPVIVQGRELQIQALEYDE
jgi:hydrogenase nickel incorporation protein HypA/HybF